MFTQKEIIHTAKRGVLLSLVVVFKGKIPSDVKFKVVPGMDWFYGIGTTLMTRCFWREHRDYPMWTRT